MVEHEVTSLYEAAFSMMKQVLADTELVEAVRRGIGRYTKNVEVEFQAIDQARNASLNEAFKLHRGAGYMLWDVCIELLRTHQVEESSQITPELLEDKVYQTYSRSGASGY